MKKAGHRYFHVDVFAESKYAGNSLAVVVPSVPIPAARMQAIAREFNFPETTFITSEQPKRGGYPVRIFTPAREVPFAGHPALGTAWVIRRHLARRAKPPQEINLNLKVGRIPVRFPDGDDGVSWMTQKPPEFGPVHSRAAAAALLGLQPEDLDPRFPAQTLSTGMPVLLIPLRNLGAVKRAREDSQAAQDYFGNRPDGTTARLPLFAFSPETYAPANRINCRMFAAALGVPEDPATGSANGCLAGYLSRHRFFGSDAVDITVEQGYEMGRKAKLHIRAQPGVKGISVEVGGRVIAVAEGMLV